MKKNSPLCVIHIRIHTRYIIKCSELYKLLLKNGWEPISQKGSHIKLKHKIIHGQIIIPFHGAKEVSKGLEMKIKKKAGLK